MVQIISWSPSLPFVSSSHPRLQYPDARRFTPRLDGPGAASERTLPRDGSLTAHELASATRATPNRYVDLLRFVSIALVVLAAPDPGIG